jgi:hypothetical protein
MPLIVLLALLGVNFILLGIALAGLASAGKQRQAGRGGAKTEPPSAPS